MAHAVWAWRRGGAGRALAAAVLVLGLAAGAWAQPAAMVVLDAARQDQLEEMREATGELAAVRRSLLATQEDGWVVEFSVREGDVVKQGQVVAKLDDAIASLEVMRAESVLRKWESQIVEQEADLAKRRRDLSKREEARAKGSATDTEIADAQTLVATSQSRLDQAKAELATGRAELGLAQKRLADMVIRAPLSGRVQAKRTEVGQWVKRGDPVIDLIQLDPIEAWLDVPESVAAQLQRSLSGAKAGEGDAGKAPTIQVRFSALGEVRTGVLAAILPRADSLSRLVPIRVALENKDELLRPGMSVTGLVPSGQAGMELTIHKDALLRNDAGAYVYFNAGGVAQIARVSVLFGAGDRLAVRSDQLKAGMEVVVEGNERLFPGQPLAPMPARQGAGSGADGKGSGTGTPSVAGK